MIEDSIAQAAEAAVPIAKAVVAGATPVVETTSGKSVATGVWTLVAIIGPAILVLLGSIARWGPSWMEKINGRRKSDLERLDDRVSALERELKIETAGRVKAELQLGYLIAAFSMVSAELERRDPDSIVIRQARDMVAKATSKDGLSGDLIQALNMAPDSPGKAHHDD